MKGRFLLIPALCFLIAFLLLSFLFSCSGGEPRETLPETETAADTTDVPETEPPDYAALLPEEYKYLYIDVPQVIVDTGGAEIGWNELAASLTVVEYNDGRVRIIDEDNGTIRIRGNTTASTEKKNFSIRFEDKHSLIGMDSGKRWILQASVFDKSLMRCKLVCDFSQHLRLPYASQGEYCDLWLNGEYRGSYLLMEPVAEGKGRVDINSLENEFILEWSINRTEGGVSYITTPIYGSRFEFDKPENPTREQYEFLNEFFQKTEEAIKSRDHERYGKYINIGSFVDFYIMNELFKDIDFNEFSTRYFIKDDMLYAGPPWDFDLSMGNCSYGEPKYYEYHNDAYDGSDLGTGDSAEGFWCRRDWYADLISDEYFHGLMVDRFIELQPLIKGIYEGDDNWIDRIKLRYADSFKRNYEIFKVNVSYGYYDHQEPKLTYDGNVGLLRQWLKRRNTWLIENMDSNELTALEHVHAPEYKPH
jgi:hypothetical protein